MTNTVNMTNAVTQYTVGQNVEVYSFGRWYAGTVLAIGRTRLTVRYTAGKGQTREKAFTMDLVKLPGAPLVKTFPTSKLTDAEIAVGWFMCTNPECNPAKLVKGCAHAHWIRK